jgi:hypothetical protein
VHVAVHRDLVPGIGDLARERRCHPHHLAEHEERRRPSEFVEHGEELRGRRGVGAVVEGQRDVTGASDADQSGREAHTER